ncbi:hypothetical protein FDZ74_15980, partial [bacterium]
MKEVLIAVSSMGGMMNQVTGIAVLDLWKNFYMVIGTAAATLTGLMFIVTTLLAGVRRYVATIDAGMSAFGTPTVVHFCTVLLIAGILSAPWQAFLSLSLLLGSTGVAGAIYLIVVLEQMRHIPSYQTQAKDWLWYLAFPLLAYLVLITGAVALPVNPGLVLYFISAATVFLLFIGIRNAWDLVTYLAIER